jgi:uncharacterized OsmC-like protein
MGRVNNVDITRLEKFTKEMEQEPAKAKKTQVIEGEWVLEEGGAQFKASISYENGKTIFESDQPTNLGGGGTLPGPMHYCFFGLASCYTSTFATMASMMGIKLEKLSCRVEADVNFSKVFGLSEEPIMEGVRVTLQVKSDASEEKLKEVEQLAFQRCPVVFTLTTPVKLKTKMEIVN